MKNMWIEAHKYLLEMGIGDSYLAGGNEVKVIRKTKSKIYLSNGVIIWIRERNGIKYFDGKVTNKKSVGVHMQVLRDVEGYLIYKLLTCPNGGIGSHA